MKTDLRNPKIVLAVAPTHRNDPSFPPDMPVQHKEEILNRLRELGIEFVDLDDVCPYGLLTTNHDVESAYKKFYDAKPDALFIPFTDFGSEGCAAQLASKFDIPVLLWGQREGNAQGTYGDQQCGLIAAGKVFRRFKINFTYFPTCHLYDDVFEKGIRTFLAVANVVKTFRNCYVLQVGPRPETFWSVMCDEGALLEHFNIKIFPLSMTDIVSKTKEILSTRSEEVKALVEVISKRADVHVSSSVMEKSAALKLALDWYQKETHTTCCAFQCWHSLQAELGIWPCTAMSLLNEEGFPCVCEMDVHGAISALLASAATMGRTTSYFTEWTFRHPILEHAEYLGHCGSCSMELFEEKPMIGTRCFEFAKNMGGHVCGIIKSGEVSFFRFDGDNNEYSMLLGTARTIDEGDTCKRGARIWLELPDIRKFERHVVYGPYIHHCVLIHEDITPVMLEAAKYMGVKADFVYEEQFKKADEYLLFESMPNGPEGMVVVPGEPMIGAFDN